MEWVALYPDSSSHIRKEEMSLGTRLGEGEERSEEGGGGREREGERNGGR